MITRTIKNTKVNFLNIDIEKRTFDEMETVMEYGMTEKQIEKALKADGYNPVNIKTENIPAARYGMIEKDFFLLGQLIDKKNDISGRSVTKEMEVRQASAVFATKINSVWEIHNSPVYMINGNFDSRDYISKSVRLLEIVGEWEQVYNGMVGMSEEKFMEMANIIE